MSRLLSEFWSLRSPEQEHDHGPGQTARERAVLGDFKFAGSVSARAYIDGNVIPVEIITTQGLAEVCVKLPAHAKGKGLTIRAVDGKGNSVILCRFIS